MIAASRAVFDVYRAKAAVCDAALRFPSAPSPQSSRRLLDAAEDHGERLRKASEASGGLVAVLASTQEAQFKHVIAALSAGLVPAVLTPPNRKLARSYYIETTRAVLSQIAPAVVATDHPDEVALAMQGLPRSFVLTDEHGNQIEDRVKSFASARPMPDDAAFVQFSSGTTGIKKGVSISRKALMSQLSTYGQALSMNEADHIVSWLPLYHDMGYITALHLALYWGVDVTMLDPIEWVGKPDSYLREVADRKATLGWHPNFAFAFMAQRSSLTNQEVDLSSLRSLVNCSEPVTAPAQQQFLDRFVSCGLRKDVMTGCYAMAESTYALTHGVDSAHLHLDFSGPQDVLGLEVRKPYVSVGEALPGVDIEVRGRAGQVGEIWVRSAFLADGYFGDEKATASTFVDGWYNTGDLGYQSGSQLYVLGRAKDVLIVAGHNVFPDDIESVVGEATGVKAGRVACFGVFDDRNQTERLVVLAEVDGKDGAMDLTAIRQRLLAVFGVSVNVSAVEPGWLVKSTAGKISRAKSRERWLSL